MKKSLPFAMLASLSMSAALIADANYPTGTRGGPPADRQAREPHSLLRLQRRSKSRSSIAVATTAA